MNNQLELDIRRGATSASSAQADLLCPGRHFAQKGIKPPEASEDAQFGRVIHAALADSAQPATMAKLTGEQRDIFDSCREIEKKLIEKFFGADKAPKRVFREQRLWCKVPAEKPKGDTTQKVFFEHSGQPDVVVRAGPRGLILEYKTLAGDVPESPTNLQLRDQAALAAGSFLLTEIGAAVVQPLVTSDPTITVYDAGALKIAQKEMFDRVRRSNDPGSPRVPGEVQCKYCLAKGVCKEYAAWASRLLPTTVALPDSPIAVWTPDQLALFCEREPLCRKWLDDCKEAIKAKLKENPEAVPGWTLLPGDFRDTIKDPQGLFQRFHDLAMPAALKEVESQKPGFDVPSRCENLVLRWFMECIKVGKGDFTDKVRAISTLKGKELKAQVTKLLEGLVESKQSAPSLARKK